MLPIMILALSFKDTSPLKLAPGLPTTVDAGRNRVEAFTSSTAALKLSAGDNADQYGKKPDMKRRFCRNCPRRLFKPHPSGRIMVSQSSLICKAKELSITRYLEVSAMAVNM